MTSHKVAHAIDHPLDQAAALLSDFSRIWEIEPSPAERRKLIAQLFERIWEHEAAQKQQRHRTSKCGAEGGSDGTRTRDLWRDRPAL